MGIKSEHYRVLMIYLYNNVSLFEVEVTVRVMINNIPKLSPLIAIRKTTSFKQFFPIKIAIGLSKN